MNFFQSMVTNDKMFDLGYGLVEITMVFDMVFKTPYMNFDMVSQI